MKAKGRAERRSQRPMWARPVAAVEPLRAGQAGAQVATVEPPHARLMGVLVRAATLPPKTKVRRSQRGRGTLWSGRPKERAAVGPPSRLQIQKEVVGRTEQRARVRAMMAKSQQERPSHRREWADTTAAAGAARSRRNGVLDAGGEPPRTWSTGALVRAAVPPPRAKVVKRQRGLDAPCPRRSKV